MYSYIFLTSTFGIVQIEFVVVGCILISCRMGVGPMVTVPILGISFSIAAAMVGYPKFLLGDDGGTCLVFASAILVVSSCSTAKSSFVCCFLASVAHSIWRFPRIGLPPNHPNFNGIFHFKPSISGSPHDERETTILPSIKSGEPSSIPQPPWLLATISRHVCLATEIEAVRVSCRHWISVDKSHHYINPSKSPWKIITWLVVWLPSILFSHILGC